MGLYDDDFVQVILEARISGDEIVVRIDRDYYRQGLEGKPVTEITCKGCEKAANDFSLLLDSVGDGLDYYEISETSATFQPDFAQQLTIDCKSINETTSEYMTEDLTKKCQWLAQECLKVRADYGNLYKQKSLQVNTLAKGIADKLTRCRRKAEFFSASDPGKAALFNAQIKDYEHLLTLLQQS